MRRLSLFQGQRTFRQAHSQSIPNFTQAYIIAKLHMAKLFHRKRQTSPQTLLRRHPKGAFQAHSEGNARMPSMTVAMLLLLPFVRSRSWRQISNGGQMQMAFGWKDIKQHSTGEVPPHWVCMRLTLPLLSLKTGLSINPHSIVKEPHVRSSEGCILLQ